MPRQRHSLGVLRAILMLIAASTSIAWQTNTSRAEEPRTTVRFRLLDVPAGELTLAMVCIRNLDDKTIRLPPDGRVLHRPSQTDEFYRGIEYNAADPDWIGPPRKTLGKGDNKDRSYVYGERPSIPYWREPVMYQTQPTFTVQLESGRYHIAVSRGMEYIPVEQEFTVAAEKLQEHTIRLKRWVHLPSLGWYSGDVHVHHPTLKKTHRQFLLRYAEAEDLHVVNILEMGHHLGTDFKQQGFGKKFRVHQANYWLVSGQEEPRGTFGHIIGLNTTALARDPATYDLYDLAFQCLHDQPEALVGFAHFAWNGCNLPRGFPWCVTTEAIDFVELLQFNTINTLDYYEYLNLGFRLTAAAGSDTPWGSTIGEVRTFVHTGKELDLDDWFEGLRRGRTFVSNGPALEFSVDGQLSGSELIRNRGDVLKVQARAWGHDRVGLPDSLLLVSNQGTIRSVKRTPGQQGDLIIETQVPVQRSQWLTVSVRCPNGAVAHATPVYVVVNGEPTWSLEKSTQIVKKQLDAIARIETEFTKENNIRSRAIRQRLDRAKTYYAKLLAAIQSSRPEQPSLKRTSKLQRKNKAVRQANG